MDRTLCPRCRRSVEPLGAFEKDADGKRWWLITRCPFERCSYNLDIELYDKPRGKETKADRRGYIWKVDHWE